MTPEEMSSQIHFDKKHPNITPIEYYLEEGETELSDLDLYMIWRDAILTTGHKPTRYLTKPTKKELRHIRGIYTFFNEVFTSNTNFPHLLFSVFANFSEVHRFLATRGSTLPFEVHQLGVLEYNMGYIFEWYIEKNNIKSVTVDRDGNIIG